MLYYFYRYLLGPLNLEKRIIDWVNDDEFVKLFKDDFSFTPLKQKGCENLNKKNFYLEPYASWGL